MALRVNGSGVGKCGGDAFARMQDVFGEELMECGKERLIATEDGLKARSMRCSGFLYSGDDGCEDGCETGE